VSDELDEVDRKILAEYVRDSRSSFREVAKRIGVSTGTVIAHTKRMEKEGIIRSYSAVVDWEKVGYQLTAVTEIKVSKGKLLEMEREIAKIPCTYVVYDITGSTDAVVMAKFRSREELSQFTKAILAMSFVESTNTHLVLTTVKEDYRLPVEFGVRSHKG